MVNKIGIIQGRLVFSNGVLQKFPDDNWCEEFSIANKLGLDYLELITDVDYNSNNPLYSGDNLEKMSQVSSSSNIGLYSVTIDHIMKNTLYDSYEKILPILKNINKLGLKIVVLPFLEGASIKGNPAKIEEVINFLDNLPDSGLIFSIESDATIDEQIYIMNKTKKPIKICYDTGNRTFLGYNIHNEIVKLGELISHVHIKDKLKTGENVMLGTGEVDFEGAFSAFKKINYRGCYTMETCRGLNEVDAAIKNLKFIKEYVPTI